MDLSYATIDCLYITSFAVHCTHTHTASAYTFTIERPQAHSSRIQSHNLWLFWFSAPTPSTQTENNKKFLFYFFSQHDPKL